MMKILITGITGMVGSHFLDFLMENTDYEIIGISRWRSPLDNISAHIFLNKQKNRLFLEHCDIRDSLGVHNLFSKYKFKYIFHLAAQSYPHVSFTNPIETYQTNVEGTENILNAALKYSPDALFMFVLHQRSLEEFQRKKCLSMKKLLFIQHHHMQFQNVVRI